MSEQAKGNQPTPAAAAALTAEQVAAAERAALAEGTAQGAKAGSEAERARVRGILGHAEAAGRRGLAEHLAFNTASSVDDAAAMLKAAPKETATEPANRFAAAMDAAGNPKVGADADAGKGDEPIKVASAAEVYNFRRACVEEARRKAH